MNNTYGVFIIESLEDHEYLDGEILEGILKLSNVKVEYRRVYDKEELKNSLEEFSKSGFRYLHISCHASDQTLDLSHDTVFYEEFGNLIENKVNNKRIFLSACDTGNRNFASIIIKHGAFSVIGSPTEIHFDKAVLFWASFFHVVNYLDEVLNYMHKPSMRRNEIKSALKSCVEIFQIPINFYSYIKDNPNKMRRLKIKPHLTMQSKMDSRIINLNQKKTKNSNKGKSEKI